MHAPRTLCCHELDIGFFHVFFNEDGLGAIVNSSRGIIAAYKQEKYASFGELNYADASRQAVKDMIEDISTALNNR